MRSVHAAIAQWIPKRLLVASLLLGVTLAFLIPIASAVLTPTPAGITSTWIYGSLGTAEKPIYCIGDHTTTPIASRLILEFQPGAEVLWSANARWADFGPPDVPQWAAPALQDAIAPKKVMLDARGWPFRAIWLSAELDEGGSVASVSGGLNLRTSLSSVPRDRQSIALAITPRRLLPADSFLSFSPAQKYCGQPTLAGLTSVPRMYHNGPHRHFKMPSHRRR